MKTRPSKRARIDRQQNRNSSNDIAEVDGVDDQEANHGSRKDDKDKDDDTPAVTPPPPVPPPTISLIKYKKKTFELQGCDGEVSIDRIPEEHRYAVYQQLIRHIQTLVPQKRSESKRKLIRMWLHQVQNDSLRFQADMDHRNGKEIYAFCCQFHCKCNEVQKTKHGWRIKNNRKKRGRSSMCDNWITAWNSGNGLIHHRQCCHQVNMEHEEEWRSPFLTATDQYGIDPVDSDVNDPLYKKSQEIMEMKKCKENKLQAMKEMYDQDLLQKALHQELYRSAVEINDKKKANVLVINSGIGSGTTALKKIGIRISKIVHMEENIIASHVARCNHDFLYNMNPDVEVDKNDDDYEPRVLLHGDIHDDKINHVHYDKLSMKRADMNHIIKEHGPFDVVLGTCNTEQQCDYFHAFFSALKKHEKQNGINPFFLLECSQLRGEALKNTIDAFDGLQPTTVDPKLLSTCEQLHEPRMYFSSIPLPSDERLEDIYSGFDVKASLGDDWEVLPYDLMNTANGLDNEYEIVKFKPGEDGEYEMRYLTSQDCEKMLGYPQGYLSTAMDCLDFELKNAIQREESQDDEKLQAKAQFRVLLDYKYNKFAKLAFLIGPQSNFVGGKEFFFDLFWPHKNTHISKDVYSKGLLESTSSVPIMEFFLKPLENVFLSNKNYRVAQFSWLEDERQALVQAIGNQAPSTSTSTPERREIESIAVERDDSDSDIASFASADSLERGESLLNIFDTTSVTSPAISPKRSRKEPTAQNPKNHASSTSATSSAGTSLKRRDEETRSVKRENQDHAPNVRSSTSATSLAQGRREPIKKENLHHHISTGAASAPSTSLEQGKKGPESVKKKNLNHHVSTTSATSSASNFLKHELISVKSENPNSISNSTSSATSLKLSEKEQISTCTTSSAASLERGESKPISVRNENKEPSLRLQRNEQIKEERIEESDIPIIENTKLTDVKEGRPNTRTSCDAQQDDDDKVSHTRFEEARKNAKTPEKVGNTTSDGTVQLDMNIVDDFKAQLRAAINKAKSSGEEGTTREEGADTDVVQKVTPHLQQVKDELIASPYVASDHHKVAEASMKEKEAVDRTQAQEAIEKKQDDKKPQVLQKNQDSGICLI